ncbi:MAG: Stp1/IreP family PP2C-type Ser/Thr phosphatase [Bacilli bacterium]|nr:Stp1/IreP family PP2C-type Ser/Thr phosphatase [Bacilli bacterium]
MITHYQTDTGKVRSHNEDSVTIVKNLNNEYLLVVADGMGGHKAGEVASSKAVTIMGSRFAKLSSIGKKEEAILWLREIVDEINLDILKYAEENIDSKGLGTTCVCAILTPEYLIFGNIGDSSGFVMKQGKLTKVTNDHTIVGLLLKNGDISEEEARNHPQKNVLMKALGSQEKVTMDMFDVETDIDSIFLCTDGLTNMVSKDQIEKILNDEMLSAEEKASKLILKANVRGGTDNITVAYLSRKEGI